MSLLIKNGKIITMGDDPKIIENGSIYIKNGRIEDFGNNDEVEKRNEKPTEEIDAENNYVMPGMINSHMHLYSTFARGMSLSGEPATTFVEILEKLWWRLDKKLTLEDCYYSALMPMIDCIKKGVTTIIDHHASPYAIMGSLDENEKAAKEIGIRSSFCYELSDRDGIDKRNEGIEENIRFIKKCNKNNDDMVKAMFGLHAAFTLSDESLEKARESVEGLNAGFHIHTAEGIADENDSEAKHKMRIVERLKKFDILGHKTLTIHCVHVNEKEIDILKEADTCTVHNPYSNMGNAVGVAPMLDMVKKGLVVGLGTDGYNCDILEGMKLANVLHKLNTRDPRVSWTEPPLLAFKNNSIIAERQFGYPIGVIKKGGAGDVLIVDYKPWTPMTNDNIFSHIHFGFSSHNIKTVVANGKILMKDHKLVNIDEERISRKSQELAKQLWKRI